MKGKRKKIRICAAVAVLVFLLAGCAGDQGKSSGTVTISVWHYYNGVQQKAFDRLVGEFNGTVGKEQGILVESYSQGSVENLLQLVMDAADQKVGAERMPNICSAYADTAYTMYLRGLTADIAPYLSREEKENYVQGYLEEGEFAPGEITIFPVAKATEVLVLNKTDWDEFARESGAGIEQLATYEQLAQVAEAYYQWTDERTPEPGDGKALFGRDAIANLFFTGFRQQGQEIIVRTDNGAQIRFDKQIARKIWDVFYVPYLKGHYYKGGRFSSDDMATGQIIAYVGSSSGASYIPGEVMVDDNQGYPIEILVLECPILEGGEKIAVQQGAGMTVLQSSPEEVEASAAFLKWFTGSGRNVEFTSAAGYLPVTCDTNTGEVFDKQLLSMEKEAARSMARVSMDMTKNWKLYTPGAVSGSEQVRSILERTLLEKAQADRAAVEAMVASGSAPEEAQEKYLQESCFEEWYENTKAELEEAVE